MNHGQKSTPEIRTWDILAAVLLVCAILTAVTRLVVTKWTEELYVVQTLAFLGVLLGLAIGYSRFSPRLSLLLSVAYGAVMIPWQIGMTLGPGFEWKDRLEIMYDRLATTIDIVIRSKPVNDNILFVYLMSILFWAISVHAGYSLVRRGNAWRAVLPAGLAMLVIHSYDPYIVRRIWFLAVYLFFTLLLVARVTFAQQRLQWKQNRTFVAPDLGFDWIRFTLLASVVLIIFSWAVPALAETLPPAQQAWQYIRRPWVEFQDKVSNAFSSLQSSVGVVSDYYGQSLSLGRGSALTNTPILSIDAPPKNSAGIRFYWRAYTYNQYEDGQWRSTQDDTTNLTSNTPKLEPPSQEKRWVGSFTITPFYSIATLYAPDQPLWVSVPAKASISRDNEGNSVDLIAIQAQPSVSAGKSYKVDSSISAATEADLRAAGKDYPQWVEDSYLQLPNNISVRTRQLAAELSSGLDNPYDIANAITNYLRSYQYSEVIESPPSGQELIDWWLFDYRRGFCQYYATAEIVLLRSLGIPARMAVGYAQGEFRSSTNVQAAPGQNVPSSDIISPGTYTVRQKDAHAWPEVYFPKYGWMEFEPTASQSALARLSGAEGTGTDQIPLDDNLLEKRPTPDPSLRDRANDTAAQQQQAATTQARLIMTGIAMFLTAGVALFAVVARRRGIRFHLDLSPVPMRLEKGFYRVGLQPPDFLKRWSRYAALPPLVHAYLEINRALKRLGKPAGANHTPAERGVSLSGILPPVAEPTQSLIAEYQNVTYGQKRVDGFPAREAGWEIRKQSYLAMIRRLLSRLKEPQPKNGRPDFKTRYQHRDR
jgi:transglutaminase-like putative cysteine protease